jgi:beta-N-acetylhexosaminidase
MKKIAPFLLLLLFSTAATAQYKSTLSANDWVDSVFKSLSKEEKIAQLMVIRAHSNFGADHVASVTELVRKYNVGAFCWFQGGPLRQANLNNYYQSIARTPIMMTIDGEWGLGMRLDSVTRYPYQLTLGALTDDKLVYEMGRAVGRQMKRIGIHVNYAPVVDVNNNPNNPVIGYRSFGEDKYKVARFGLAYSRGMQDEGIMACAKHFPGHGDVDVDSHYDLPVITKSRGQLDSLELYPFRELFAGGVGSVMVAHLAIPAIDTVANQPTSLSSKNINELLRRELRFSGLTFTDALEMKGVSKFYPAGEAAVQALIAGNDMLCLPENVPAAIEAVQAAVKKKRIRQADLDEKVRKVLLAKYQLGLNQTQWIDTANLLADLNKDAEPIRRQVARNAVTVMKNTTALLPLMGEGKTAFVALGSTGNEMGRRLREEMGADVYYLGYRDSTTRAAAILDSVNRGGYNRVLIGVHNYNNRPTGNYGISTVALNLWDSLQQHPSATFAFGNVYATQRFLNAPVLVTMHQDDEPFQHAAVDFLQGKIASAGKLPVTVGPMLYGSGMAIKRFVPVGTSPAWLVIDSIVQDAMAKRAFPGCVVLAVQNGEIKYHKAFGRYEFDARSQPVTLESIYDLASVTKISATTVAIMKLVEQGKVSLDKTLGDYLPYTLGSDKAGLKVRDILLHQAGLNPFISFYRETIDKETGAPSDKLYARQRDTLFTIPVARNVWLRRDWNDTMLQRIVTSKLGPAPKYVYSDNDFILLGKIVETVSGMPLDQYTQKTFYNPLGMATTTFKPWQRFGMERVVPTEEEKHFRKQLLRGYVHDEGAAMFGGVSGHAGLFSNAYDLSLLYQMLLNGGMLNGERFLKPETVGQFTAYGSDISRRGLGFDKGEKDNATRKEPYPSALASPQTYGHTGFTGTCVWVDPQSKLVYVFLSNRVYNTRDNNLLGQLGVRGKIQDAIYRALQAEKGAGAAKVE